MKIQDSFDGFKSSKIPEIQPSIDFYLSLSAELNITEASMASQNVEIEKLNADLRDYKQKYLELKKREQREAQPLIHEAMIKPTRKDGPKFAGGGFNLKSYKIT